MNYETYDQYEEYDFNEEDWTEEELENIRPSRIPDIIMAILVAGNIVFSYLCYNADLILCDPGSKLATYIVHSVICVVIGWIYLKKEHDHYMEYCYGLPPKYNVIPILGSILFAVLFLMSNFSEMNMPINITTAVMAVLIFVMSFFFDGYRLKYAFHHVVLSAAFFQFVVRGFAVVILVVVFMFFMVILVPEERKDYADYTLLDLWLETEKTEE